MLVPVSSFIEQQSENSHISGIRRRILRWKQLKMHAYRVSNLLPHLGRVTSDFESFTVYPLLACSALADRNSAEVADKLSQMVEHTNKRQLNPGARADETPCIVHVLQMSLVTDVVANMSIIWLGQICLSHNWKRLVCLVCHKCWSIIIIKT